MRSFRLALALSLFGASACSFLLDTEALQKKGAGGAGGSGSDLDAGREGGIGCTSDLDCMPVDTVDGCMRYQCAADSKTCLAPVPYSGLGIVSVPGDAETAEQADDIGYPSLLADGTDLVLAAWKRTGTASNIVVRKYDERPEISPTSADLNAITTNRFESISSSPGLIIRTLPRRIQMLAAAKVTGGTATGMYQMTVDLSTLRVSNMQPTKVDLAITGYDTSPRGPAPRLLPGPALGEPVGMWMQQGKLFYFDANTTGEVFSSKRVIGFAPIAANAGLHAALETTDLASTDDQGETELWTRGSPSLTALINDQPGGKRRGVATTATAEGLAPVNFVVWSFERQGTQSTFYAAASCDANSCTAIGSPAGGNSTLPAVAPAVASAKVTGSVTDRDMAATFQITTPDPSHASMVNTSIIGGVTRLTTGVDAGQSISAVAMNPPNFFVTLTPLAAANVGPSSVAMTGGGLMMVAWVERGANQALLKTRRFQVKTCP